MINPFCEVVLSDYNSNVDIARDPEVLDVIATMVNKLGVSFLMYVFFFLLIHFFF